MRKQIVKATEITDAKISFVSLVNKAANKRQFLITKSEDGKAKFQTYGSILMSDAETHYITGVVYEPMVEDSHKNYMTAAEIVKAEKYFSDNAGEIDIQHSFEPEKNITVVESWITKCDCTINGTDVKKGSWLMTVKIQDDNIWDKVVKGEITGFSMGGVGKYSDVDVDLDNVSKAENESAVKAVEKKALIVKLAEAFGYECVKKGTVSDEFEKRSKQNNFWAAFNSLETTLKRRYNNFTGDYDYESDIDVITEALEEFSGIIKEILATNSVQKAVVDTQPKKKSKTAVDSDDEEENSDEKEISQLKEKSNSKPHDKKNKEEQEMTKSEVEAIVASTVTEAVKKAFSVKEEVDTVKKSDNSLSNMTPDEFADIIKSAVSTEVKKYANERGKVSNLDSEEEDVEKSEEPQHYLHGIL